MSPYRKAAKAQTAEPLEVGDVVQDFRQCRYKIRGTGTGSWSGERYYECTRYPDGLGTGTTIFYEGQVSLVWKQDRPTHDQTPKEGK